MSAWRDGADERITDLIRSELDETAPFITGWTLIVAFNDDVGEDSLAFNSMPGQRRTATLGQLTHGLEVEKANVFWDERPE